jgi:Flp pilus assembly protein CpaB
MGDYGLQPTGWERLRAASRPGWARTVAARRALAATLALLALVLAITGRSRAPTAEVLVAARDLAPGTPLTAADVRLTTVPYQLVPAGALTTPDGAVGRVVTGPVAPGELLTGHRLLTDRTAELVRPGSRLVPITPADAGTVDLLRAGDVVDVVAQHKEQGETEPRVLARDAIVAVPAPSGGKPRTVMLAMTEDEAHEVAATALSAPVTVVFR